MDKQLYLHGIYTAGELYNSKDTLKILRKILISNALLSNRLQGIEEKKISFSGLDYISLCDYEKKDICLGYNYNAYQIFIKNSLSLMFPKDKLSVIIPQTIDIPRDKGYTKKVIEYGLSEPVRYSDLPDEVQVRDKISLDLLIGLSLPLSKMQRYFYSKKRTFYMVEKELEQIKELLQAYNYNVPLYDIDTLELLEEPTTVKRLVNYYYKNRD